MNNTNGHFDLNSPEALFKKAENDYFEFLKNPNSWILFNVLTTFNHLLEWICPEADGKPPSPFYAHGTPQQIFYNQMRNQSNYLTIRALCNNSKHFKHKPNGPSTSIIKHACVGLMRAGDSLDQTYFIVEGTDIRDVLMPLYQSYKQYFDI